MRTAKPALKLLGLLALCLSWPAAVRADGPHWHVPNPDNDPYRKEEEEGRKAEQEKKKEEEKKAGEEGRRKVPGRTTVVPAFPLARAWGNTDYDQNPGDFAALDQACIRYYEKHCSISFQYGATGYVGVFRDPKKAAQPQQLSDPQKKRRFYLLIMERCAQAMREVDTYLPCPDSFPLWHTEELRDKMVQFAQRTWIRSTQLPPDYAAACAEFCAQAFADTVRFDDDVQSRRVGGWLAEFMALNKELAKLLEKMADEKDPAVKLKVQQEWRLKASKAYALVFRSGGLGNAYPTFKLVTGDIPVLVSGAAQRMMEALIQMGPGVIPCLQRAQGRNNSRVAQALDATAEMIRKRWNLNADGMSLMPTTSNVLDLLRWVARRPGSLEAQVAQKALQQMGPKALAQLVRIAENENLDLKEEALVLLRMMLKKPSWTTLAEIRSEVEAMAAAEAGKREAAEEGQTGEMVIGPAGQEATKGGKEEPPNRPAARPDEE